MFKREMMFGIAGLLFFIAGESYADTANQVENIHLVLGGSAIGLRNATKQDVEITFNVAANEILKVNGIELNIVIYPTTENLYSAFDKGEINGFFGTPIEFLAREDQLSKDLMGVVYKYEQIKQAFVVIARKEVGFSNLNDLKNKRLTLARYQDTEMIYLNTLLLKNHMPEIPVYFSDRFDVKNSNTAIMDVFFGKSDVTVVRESDFKTAVELNPQIGKQLIVVDKSVPYIYTVGAVSKKIPADQIARVFSIIKDFSNTAKGKSLLSIVQVNAVTSISMEDTQSLRDLLKEYNALKKLNSPRLTSTDKEKIKRHAQ